MPSIAAPGSEGSNVLVQRIGPALVITINRPEAGNSINVEVANAIGHALRSHQQSKDLLSIIITGSGNRFFCAGGDLKAYRALRTPAQLTQVFGKLRKLLDEIEAFRLPVIAAINGLALGGGAELALACDLRFASVGARIGFVQSTVGLIPGWNGVERLVESVGRSAAMRLLWTGEKLSSTDAQALGLIDDASKGSALGLALEFTEQLRKAGPLTLGAAKRAVLGVLRMPHRRSRELSSQIFEKLWFSTDHREAETAFVEKRLPNFRGR